VTAKKIGLLPHQRQGNAPLPRKLGQSVSFGAWNGTSWGEFGEKEDFDATCSGDSQSQAETATKLPGTPLPRIGKTSDYFHFRWCAGRPQPRGTKKPEPMRKGKRNLVTPQVIWRQEKPPLNCETLLLKKKRGVVDVAITRRQPGDRE